MSELGLRYYQEDAVRAVEKAIVNGHKKSCWQWRPVPVKPVPLSP
jgi:hypothetical protein